VTGATGVVIVGTGFGYRIQLPALRAAGFEVLALVGQDEDRTARRAARRGVPHACTSLAEALALPGVDAVAIATPPSTHVALALEALAAGRHVLCEKPFATSSDDARAMLEAQQRAGTVGMVGHEFRFTATQAAVAEMVAGGEIGAPRLASIASFAPVVASRETTLMPDWFFQRSRGGGWLGASGSHSIDRIRTWLGDITSVSASVSAPSADPDAADDSYCMHFGAASGAVGTLMESGASWLPEVTRSTVVVGSEGILTIDGSDIVVGTAAGRRVVEGRPELRDDPIEGSSDLMASIASLELAPYTRLCRTFLSTIRGQDAALDVVPATFADGVAEVEVMDAVRRSAADGGSRQPVATGDR
jgi:predicted dehydrogenase